MDQSSHTSLEAFEAGAQSWEAYTATPLGRLRQDISLHNALAHMGAPAEGARVLDAGGGTGSYALALAEMGYDVCLLDGSTRMLDIAVNKARNLAPSVAGRLTYVCAGIEEAPEHLAEQSFDLILCHTLLEYLADPTAALQTLTSLLRPDGLLSVLFVTPYADAFRWALNKQDVDMARRALSGETSTADLFGLPRRTFAPEAMHELMTQAGLRVGPQYGVRIFADYLPPQRWDEPEYYDQVLALEIAATGLHPYRLLGRYHQILGRPSPQVTDKPAE